jgi:hypothetical protein
MVEFTRNQLESRAKLGPPRLLPAAGLLALLLTTTPGYAQNNYQDIPIGGRTASMGGAATAAGSDSAMPFLNPAGLAALPDSVLALSGQVYTYSRWKVDRFFAPDGYGFPTENPTETFSATRLGQLPSSVMYMKHFGSEGSTLRGVVAMSLITPSSQSISFTGSASVRRPEVNGGLSQTRNIEYTSSDTYIGPSVAVALGDRINAGLSVFYLNATRRFVSQQTAFVYEFGGARTQENSESVTESQSTRSIVPVVGLQIKLIPGLKAGLGVAAPSIRIDGRNDRSVQQTTTGKFGQKQNFTFAGEAYGQRPLRINAGVAYEQAKSFGVAADVSFYTAVDQFYGAKGTQNVVATSSDDVTRNYNERREQIQKAAGVFNVAIGGEFWVTKALALRLGAFTNGAPVKLDAVTPYSLEINRLGLTGGVGIEAGSFETTLGVVYQHGSGKLNTPDFTSRAALDSPDARYVPVNVTEDALMFVVSGVVSTEEAQDTIEKKNKGMMPGGLQ